MSVDLSGLKVGTAWRVSTHNGDGVLFVYNLTRHPLYVVHYCDGGGYDNCDASGTLPSQRQCIKEVLGELKAPADITARDLDGRVIETEDGGKVFFGHGISVQFRPAEQRWRTSGAWPDWLTATSAASAEDIQAAYAAELERRKNPPVEIVWQDVLRIGDVVAQAWCEVRGDVWRISRLERSDYRLHRGLEFLTMRRDVEHAEQYIRDHYASTK